MAFAVSQNPSAYPCGACACGPEGESPGGWIIPALKNPDGTPWTTNICPRRQLDDGAVELLRYWRFWRQGVLLVAGGLLNQPARYVEAMEFLDYLQADANAEEAKNRGGGHGG